MSYKLIPRPRLFSPIIRWFPFGATKTFVIFWYTVLLNKIHHYQPALFLAVEPAVTHVLFLVKPPSFLDPNPNLLTGLISHALSLTWFIPYLAANAVNSTSVRLADVSLTSLPNIFRFVRNNDVDKPVARHFNSANHSISDMKVSAISSISGGNDSRIRQERRPILKLGTSHPYGLDERFSLI